MSITNNSLNLRILSAIALMPIVLLAIVYGGWAFYSMMLVGIVIALFEWIKMASLSSDKLRDTILGVLYVVLCFLSFVYIRMFCVGGEWLSIALLLSVWASDTGAYFFGKTFKGPKMAPTISPNKTWAGFIGGLAFSALVFFIFAKYAGPYLANIFHHQFAFGGLENANILLLFIGVFVTVAGQAGDLLISKQKRKVGVKDTGALIPGHGGLLDRIDSLLLVSLFLVIVLKFLAMI